MKQNITKKQVYDLGVTPENMIKLGKLTRTDYEGMVNGLRLFDKLTLETAIDDVVDQIVKDFYIGSMIEIIKNSTTEELMLLINKNECSATLLCCGGGVTLGKDSEELCDVLWDAVKTML